MYNKLSNTASQEEIEYQMGLSYKFPKLHRSEPMINGLAETNLSVIIAENPDEITFSIWGILPCEYKGDWKEFQEISNTLSLSREMIRGNEMLLDALNYRRCLIIVNGYFTHFLRGDEVYPYYVHLNNRDTFTIAGIYNQLEDGFYTCSQLLTKADENHKRIHNIDGQMPKIIDAHQRSDWLKIDQERDVLLEIFNTPSSFNSELNAFPIAKEFYKKGISYQSMLQPVFYDGIPRSIK